MHKNVLKKKGKMMVKTECKINYKLKYCITRRDTFLTIHFVCLLLCLNITQRTHRLPISKLRCPRGAGQKQKPQHKNRSHNRNRKATSQTKAATEIKSHNTITKATKEIQKPYVNMRTESLSKFVCVTFFQDFQKYLKR